MAFGSGGFKKKGTAVRLTGMWPSEKNEELVTGSMKPEQVETLAAVVERALNEGKGLYFMFWDNAKFNKGGHGDQKKAPFSLTVDVSQPQEKQEGVARFGGRFGKAAAPPSAPRAVAPSRAIQVDPNDDPFARE